MLVELESVESTNGWARKHMYDLYTHHFTTITAKKQTAGYGQHNRPWISPVGNLYASFTFCVREPFRYSRELSIDVAHQVKKVVDQCGVKSSIKWPNDILINGKKVAGILIETIPVAHKRFVICGVGINVNCTDPSFFDQIDQPATSLAQVQNKEFDLNQILHELQVKIQLLHTTFSHKNHFNGQEFEEGTNQALQ